MSWDLVGKALVKECPQDFVDYFAPGATYVGLREGQLQTELDGDFEAREIRGDNTLETVYRGRAGLVDIEWQSTGHNRMADRLLGYNYELMRQYNLPVRSSVIYTQRVGRVPQSPLVQVFPCEPLPDGNEIIRFCFASLEVCEKSVEEFRAFDRDAFYALMLLCKDGGTAAVLEEVLVRLLERKTERAASIAAAFFFASKVLTTDEDRTFMRRKRKMLKDSLEDNWLYKEIYDEMREESLEKGRAEGREEGRAEGCEIAVREDVEALTQICFPRLVTRMQALIAEEKDAQKLRELLLRVGAAKTEEELSDLFEPSEQKASIHE